MEQASALWHLSPQHSALQEVRLNTLRQAYCLIRSLYSLVSTGTERLVATGKVPPALYQAMEVPYMEGSLALPVKYGYSLTGIVEKGPPHLLHKTVHLMHPHQNWCLVHSRDVFMLPEKVSAQRAILAGNLETALNAVWDAGVSIGDKVLVAGFGIIGSLAARLLQQIPAVEVYVLETNERRRQMAADMGFEVVAAQAQDFDIAFHTTGSSSGLQACLDRVGFEGKVMELSWYGQQQVEIQLGSTFHSQRKQIISTQVSHLPANRLARWDYARRKSVVFRLLEDPVFDQHITGMVTFTELPVLFDKLRKNDLSELCWGVKYD